MVLAICGAIQLEVVPDWYRGKHSRHDWEVIHLAGILQRSGRSCGSIRRDEQHLAGHSRGTQDLELPIGSRDRGLCPWHHRRPLLCLP